MSTTLERLEYGFDRDSRRTWRKRSLTTGEDNAYGYDGLSQVVNAARGNLNLNATAIGGVPAEAQAWDYDPTGNWRGYETQTNGGVALDQLRVHDKGNRLTQIEGAPNPVLLDRAGRMREVSPDATGNWNQSQKITWDAWSRVTRIEQNGTTTASYAYDGLTRRTTRTAGSATWHSYYSDAWRPLEERRDSQTVPARQYYWGVRHRDDLVRRDRATTSGGPLNETRYVLMDYFSPAAITDETGTVKERYAFSAFGVRRILTPTFGDRATSECDFTFAFQGQFHDTESGFLNYGYRYYSPHLGRWLYKDPIGEKGGVNLYVFVSNFPTGKTDLLGLVDINVNISVESGRLASGETDSKDLRLVATKTTEDCPNGKAKIQFSIVGTIVIRINSDHKWLNENWNDAINFARYGSGYQSVLDHEWSHARSWVAFSMDFAARVDRLSIENKCWCDADAERKIRSTTESFERLKSKQLDIGRLHRKGWDDY